MRKTFIGICALFATIAGPAGAQTSAPLELTGYVKRERVITDETGERKVERIDPGAILPGDQLIFGTSFANIGDLPVEAFVVSNPVPEAVVVSATFDPSLLVSVNGGTVWGRLSELEILDADGFSRAAMARDITHVRWVLARIDPGESGQLEFPVTVR